MSFPTLSHNFWPDLAPLSSPIREMDRKLKITRQFERIKDKGEQHNYVIVAIGQESNQRKCKWPKGQGQLADKSAECETETLITH